MFGCEGAINKGNEFSVIDCPAVFFSSENNIYAHGDLNSLDFEKIYYKAILNNYGLNNCYADSNNNNYFLDLLILVEPINPTDKILNLPIFVILYDSNDDIIDRHYFRIKDQINYSEANSKYNLTEVVGNLKIILDKSKKVNSMSIGFIKIAN